MARPKKIGLEYFPMDVDFDDKIDAIEMLHGNDGLVWVIKFWQAAYKTELGEVNFAGLFAELFAKKCRITIEKHKEILETSLNIGFCYLSEKQLYTSNGIKKRIASVSKERQDAIERQEKRKEKDSKVEESIVKETPHYSPNNLILFKSLIPPQLQWVKDYCEQRKNGIDADTFMDHNTSKGWLIGKSQTKMKDWQAAVRTWEKNKKNEPRQQRFGRVERPISEIMDQMNRIKLS